MVPTPIKLTAAIVLPDPRMSALGREPRAWGMKVTLKWQLAPAGSAAAQSFVWA
jgi:hypothetical protein